MICDEIKRKRIMVKKNFDKTVIITFINPIVYSVIMWKKAFMTLISRRIYIEK